MVPDLGGAVGSLAAFVVVVVEEAEVVLAPALDVDAPAMDAAAVDAADGAGWKDGVRHGGDCGTGRSISELTYAGSEMPHSIPHLATSGRDVASRVVANLAAGHPAKRFDDEALPLQPWRAGWPGARSRGWVPLRPECQA